MNKSLGNAIAVFSSIAPCTIGNGATAASATGTGVDRKGYESAVFSFHNAQPAGTPLNVTITCTIEESADNSTFAAVDSPAAVTHNVTNTYTVTEVSCDLVGLDRYVRAVMSTQFNSGTNPTVAVSAEAILGMKTDLPA